jgi:hypothetical protein
VLFGPDRDYQTAARVLRAALNADETDAIAGGVR